MVDELVSRIAPITAVLLSVVLAAAFVDPTPAYSLDDAVSQPVGASAVLADQFCTGLDPHASCHMPGTPFDGGGNGHCRIESNEDYSPVLVCHPDAYFDYHREISPPPIYPHRKEACEQRLQEVQQAVTRFTPEELARLRKEGTITAQEQATLEYAQRERTLADVCPEFADAAQPTDRYCHTRREGDVCTVTGDIGIHAATFSGMCKMQAVTHTYYHEGQHRLVRDALVCSPPNPVVHRFDVPAVQSNQAAASTYGMLDCGRTDLSERQLLQQTPHGATRADPNTLVLNWSKGSHAFSNQRSKVSKHATAQYFYCGYDMTRRIHLILEDTPALQTGILLNDDDGTMLPGGITVLFSPDGSQYLTIRQPDGLDGEEWVIYTKDGNKVWEGISRILGKDGETFVADLTSPAWTTDNKLKVQLRCNDRSTPEQSAVLQRVDGNYRWLSEPKCVRP